MHEDRRRDLADAMRDEKELQKCYRHGSAVYFDEVECPACRMLRESYMRPKVDKIWKLTNSGSLG
jgi:hypothetical protein